MGVRPLYIFVLLQRGDRQNLTYVVLQRGYRLKSSESDVYRRQILTTTVGSRAVRVKALSANMIVSTVSGFISRLNQC